MESERELRGDIVSATARVARGTAAKIAKLVDLRSSNNQQSACDAVSRSRTDYRYQAQLTKNTSGWQRPTS